MAKKGSNNRKPRGHRRRRVPRDPVISEQQVALAQSLLVAEIDFAADPYSHRDADEDSLSDDGAIPAATITYDDEDGEADDDEDESLSPDDVAAIVEEGEADLLEALSETDVKKKLVKSNTLPDVPTLYGLERTVCGQQVSSEATTKCMFPWHVWACEQTGRLPYVSPIQEDGTPRPRKELFGLSLFRPSSFTDSMCDPFGYDSQFLGDVFARLNLYCTSSQMKKMVVFYNAHLKAEHKNRMLAAGHPDPKLGDPKVGQNQEVKMQIAKSMGMRAGLAMEQCQDLFSGIDNLITPEEIHRVLHSVFFPPDGGKVEKMHVLNRVNFGSSFCASQQDVRRGDEHYSQKMVQRFTRVLTRLGPKPGTNCSFIMTRQAKHNKTGRIELMAYGPHLDPMRDASSWQGLMWLMRVFHLKEVLVHFTDEGKFDYQKQYQVATYRAAGAGGGGGKKKAFDQRIGKVVYRNLWRSFWDDCGIYLKKLTSIWRMQAFHEMDDLGLSDSQMARMSGHRRQGKDQTSAQAQNYQTNVTVQGVSARAGNDETSHPERHFAPAQAVRQLVTAFCSMLCADNIWFWSHKMDQLHDACKSQKERENLRLVTGKACVDALKLDVENAIRLLASRPVDLVTGKPDGDCCFFDMYRKSPTFHSLFNLPAFTNPLWRELVTAVAAAEDLAHTKNIDHLINKPVRNCLDEMEKNITDVVLSANLHVRTEIQGMRDEFALLRSTLFQHCSVPCSASSTAPFSSSDVSQSAVQKQARVPSSAIIPIIKPKLVNKKRACVSQERARAAEVGVQSGTHRPVLKDMDSQFTTYDQLWEFGLWVREMDKTHGGTSWRCNSKVQQHDPTTGETSTELKRANSQWISKRHWLWDVPFHIWQSNLSAARSTEEKNVAESSAKEFGRRLFKDAQERSGKPQGKPSLKHLTDVFTEAAKDHQLWTKGRPKGSSDGVKRRKTVCRSPTDQEAAFEHAFRHVEPIEGDRDQEPQFDTEEERAHYEKMKAEYLEKQAYQQRRDLNEAQRQQAISHGGWYEDWSTGNHVRVPPPEGWPGVVIPTRPPATNRPIATSLQGIPNFRQHNSPTFPRGSPIVELAATNAEHRRYVMGSNAARFAHAHRQRQLDGRHHPPEHTEPSPPPSPHERIAVVRRPPEPFPRSAKRYIQLLREMPANSGRNSMQFNFVNRTDAHQQPNVARPRPENAHTNDGSNGPSDFDGLGYLIEYMH